MTGIFVFATYLYAGYVCARVVLWDKSPLIRVWVGLSFGVLLMMWLPALAAFAVRFTVTAEIIALGALTALTCGASVWRWKHPRTVRGLDKSDRGMLIALLCFALPLTLLSAYLQHTHTLRAVDGGMNVGQATYGDLCMHLSIITSLRGSPLPADYSLLPGTTLGYPILTDGLSTSMLLLGTPLRWTMIIPGTVMSALVYGGFLLLAREMTGKTSAAVVAGLLLFLNGGLGFVYDFDMSGSSAEKISEIFTGYYKTPANQPDFNLRWSNLVADLLLPQRTFLGGWTIVLPAFYFAREAFKKYELRMFLLVALFAASLPLIHAHSLMSLGLYSAGALVYQFFAGPKERRRKLLTGAGIYVGIVVALAVPQLVITTLKQVTRDGFMRFHYGWVNNTSGGFMDFEPWFWLKNIGLPLIPMLCALIDWKKRDRMDFIGAALIFVVANTLLFQPLDYDNNKLFYLWFLLMLPSASAWCVSLWNRMRGVRSRALLAALFLVGSTLSGALSIAREAISDYQLFSRADAELGEYIDNNTDPDAMFITGFYHNSPTYALAGRDVVCGPDLFLFWHGLDYMSRKAQVTAFYADPLAHLDLLTEYGVDYIVSGPQEHATLVVNDTALQLLFDVFYETETTTVYAVGDSVPLRDSAPTAKPEPTATPQPTVESRPTLESRSGAGS